MNKNDLISRATVIKELLNLCPEKTEPGSLDEYGATVLCGVVDVVIKRLPAIDAIPIEWLNERHRRCCKEADTDLMDAITVLCNEYHVWQKEQETR